MVLNNDDPNVSRLGKANPDNKNVYYFSVEKYKYATENLKEAGEGKFCPFCNTRIEYEYYQYSHIGKFRCPNCDYGNNEIYKLATDVDLKHRTFKVDNISYKVRFNSIYNIYNKEIKKIINNENTKAIYLVGSSKNVDLQSDNTSVNDIDLFVFTKNGDKQTRIVKYIENIEFDINYFSEKEVQKFINEKEYFFLKEMKNPKVVYDKLGISKHIIGLCKEKFTEGPNKLSKEDINLLEANLYAKIEDLKNKEKFDAFEYEFLTNLYLKDIIVGYFIINNKWLPKDKKLFKSLKDENIELFRLCKKVIETYEYKDLINVYKYIFI